MTGGDIWLRVPRRRRARKLAWQQPTGRRLCCAAAGSAGILSALESAASASSCESSLVEAS
jgi:hypothetical protein